MAVHAAGFARSSAARRTLFRRRLLIVAGAVVLLAGLGIAGYKLKSKFVAKPAPQSAPQLSYDAKQAADVQLVGGAISQYAADNGALPTQLSVAPDGSGVVLCGTICDPVLYEVTGLSVYRPANIKMVGYRPDIAVPDINTMYVVPGAKCSADGHLGDPSTSPRATVILYDSSRTSGPISRCVVL